MWLVLMFSPARVCRKIGRQSARSVSLRMKRDTGDGLNMPLSTTTNLTRPDSPSIEVEVDERLGKGTRWV